MQFLSHQIRTFTFQETCKQFSKWLYNVAFQPAIYSSSYSSKFSPVFSAVSFFLDFVIQYRDMNTVNMNKCDSATLIQPNCTDYDK